MKSYTDTAAHMTDVFNGDLKLFSHIQDRHLASNGDPHFHGDFPCFEDGPLPAAEAFSKISTLNKKIELAHKIGGPMETNCRKFDGKLSLRQRSKTTMALNPLIVTLPTENPFVDILEISDFCIFEKICQLPHLFRVAA
jgi:hypothetical protein